MEEHEALLLVGVIRSVSSGIVSERSFTVSELIDEIGNMFQIEFAQETIRTVMSKAARIGENLSIIEHISSKYASDRFVLYVSEPRTIAQVCDAVDAWDRALRAGDEWLREVLLNIRNEIEADESVAPDTEQSVAEINSVPASDRYVSTRDNQPSVEAISRELRLVREQVESSNSIDDEARLISLSEIALFESAICQPRLAVDIIERFLKFCSTKLLVWLGLAVVEFLVEKLKALLDDFIVTMASVG